MREPQEPYLSAREGPVLSRDEIQAYLYGISEADVPPTLITRWVAGEQFDAVALLDCFRGDARRAVASHDESLGIVRLAVERLEALVAR